jgi:L-lactate dehydrogenase complex protein LldG
MKVSPAKENILKKIRKALSEPTPIPFPLSEGNSSVYQPSQQELEVEFAEQFSKLLGRFVFCLDQQDLIAHINGLIKQEGWEKVFCKETALLELFDKHKLAPLTQEDLAGCDVSITTCDLLIARTGSIVLSAGQESGRTVSVYAPVHICVAYVSQLVYDIKDGLIKLKEKYNGQLPSLVTFATGPSRTADIEKTLVVGVHGPKEVYLFLVEDEQ